MKQEKNIEPETEEVEVSIKEIVPVKKGTCL